MAQSDTGLVHVYTGNGKGKTTAVVGLAVRAAGAGLAVRFVQFMKERESGEVAALAKLGVTVIRGGGGGKFTFQMSLEEKAAYARAQDDLWRTAIADPAGIDLLVLDEALAAVDAGLLPRRTILEWLAAKPGHLEVALTGRRADAEIIAVADYVSEINEIRHPYRDDVGARKGIEF